MFSFFNDFGPPKPFAAVSQLPAALTPLDFWSMYLCGFSKSGSLIVNRAESGGSESDNRAQELNLTIGLLVNRAVLESGFCLNRADLQSRGV